MFTPFERKRGLPIGNLTSQFFGNVYLDSMDHFVKEVLRAPYVRYVDDFALFHHDPAVLADWQQQHAKFLARRRLSLHPRKTFIAPTAEPATFLGYVLQPGGHGIRRLRMATSTASCAACTACATAGGQRDDQGRDRMPHQRLDRPRETGRYKSIAAGAVQRWQV